MSDTSHVVPHLTVLTPEQIVSVHAYSLDILSRTGVRVDSPQVRDMVAKRIGASAVQGDRVRFPRETVEWALHAAPHTLDMYNRGGERAFRLNDGRAHFGVGVTNLYYQDPATDDVMPFVRQHMALCVRLGDALPRYDVISTIGVLHDIPSAAADLFAVLEMVANTAKPLVMLISEPRLFPAALDLLEHLHGDLAARPFVIPYFNPVTPLIVNQDTSDKMAAAIDRGLPIIYSNYSMAGMSTPITPAGALVLLNAELLAGLALAQLYKDGAPIILGSLPAFFDMKAMIDVYDPYTILLDLACAEMMGHYGLPHAGTSGSGTGWGPDLPEAGTLWLNHLTSCIGRVGLAPFVGSTLGSLAFSPAAAVYAHDVIGQAQRFAQGFALDAESVGLDEIEAVGPGGNFLTAPLTMQHFRSAIYDSDIFPNLSLEKWQSQGQPTAADRLRSRTLELMDGLQPPDDHDDLLAKGSRFIEGLHLL